MSELYEQERRQLLAQRQNHLRFHRGVGDPNEYPPVKEVDAELRLLDAKWALREAPSASHLRAVQDAVANLGRKSDPAIGVLADAVSALLADHLATLQHEVDEAQADVDSHTARKQRERQAQQPRERGHDGARLAPGARPATAADYARARARR